MHYFSIYGVWTDILHIPQISEAQINIVILGALEFRYI